MWYIIGGLMYFSIKRGVIIEGSYWCGDWGCGCVRGFIIGSIDMVKVVIIIVIGI